MGSYRLSTEREDSVSLFVFASRPLPTVVSLVDLGPEAGLDLGVCQYGLVHFGHRAGLYSTLGCHEWLHLKQVRVFMAPSYHGGRAWSRATVASGFVVRSPFWARSDIMVPSKSLARSAILVLSRNLARSRVMVRSIPLARSASVALLVLSARSTNLVLSISLARSVIVVPSTILARS